MCHIRGSPVERKNNCALKSFVLDFIAKIWEREEERKIGISSFDAFKIDATSQFGSFLRRQQW